MGHFRPNLRVGSKLNGMFHGFTLRVPLSTAYLIPEAQSLLWAVPGAVSRERYALASKWPKFWNHRTIRDHRVPKQPLGPVHCCLAKKVAQIFELAQTKFFQSAN